MNLVVDYGNSSAKVGLFEDRTLVSQFVFKESDELKHFLQNFSGGYCIISTVNRDAGEVAGWVSQVKKTIVLTPALPLPVGNRYATPATLGVDRIAGACGAQSFFPDEDCLVIDAGTCITYDFLEGGKDFLGGGISPGMMMRFKAVHTFTARLPLVDPIEEVPLIGNSTTTGIQSGVIRGCIAEMDGIIDQYREKYPKLKVILSGGDARFFENKLKGFIFAVPELVLSGLNSILIHNVRS